MREDERSGGWLLIAIIMVLLAMLMMACATPTEPECVTHELVFEPATPATPTGVVIFCS